MGFLPSINKDSVPFLTADQLRQMDALMVSSYHISVFQMMELAGIATAALVRQLLSGSLNGQRVVVCAGKGHNGGDGLVAARHLLNWGGDVTVLLTHEPDQFSDEPLAHYQALEVLGCDIQGFDVNHHAALLKDAQYIVDAVLGFGLSGAPRGVSVDCIQSINGSGVPVLALDCPSGLDCSTGEVYDPCVVATQTLSLACLKSGYNELSAQRVLGDVYIGDIGVPAQLYRELGVSADALFSEGPVLSVV